MADYNNYIKSKAWHAVRRTALRRSHYSCDICGEKASENTHLHVHHLTYERFGAENIDDVVVLCEDCHNEVHEYVDYAILKSRSFIETVSSDGHGYEPWVALPHMRHSPVNLLPVILATLAQTPLAHYQDGEINPDSAPFYDVADFELRDREGQWCFVECSNYQKAKETVEHLKRRGYNTKEAADKLSPSLPVPIYVRYDPWFGGKGVSIGDYLSAKYETITTSIEII